MPSSDSKKKLRRAHPGSLRHRKSGATAGLVLARVKKDCRSREALMLRYGTTVLALVLAMAMMDRASAQRIKAGLLTCDVSAGIGFIIGSKKEMACVFTPEGPGRRDAYDGTITKYGPDLGLTGRRAMVWTVLPDTPAGPGLLSGDSPWSGAECT